MKFIIKWVYVTMSVVHLMFFLFYLIFQKRFFFFWHLFSAIYQIQDKPTLFRSFYKWLKPGGKLLITDYCKSAGSPSSEFAEYIKKGGYYLHDMKAHEQVWLGVCAISGTIFLLFHPFGFSWYLHFFCMTISLYSKPSADAGECWIWWCHCWGSNWSGLSDPMI